MRIICSSYHEKQFCNDINFIFEGGVLKLSKRCILGIKAYKLSSMRSIESTFGNTPRCFITFYIDKHIPKLGNMRVCLAGFLGFIQTQTGWPVCFLTICNS